MNYEKQIAKRIGISVGALKHLCRAAASPDGKAHGPGFGHGSGAFNVACEARGFVERKDMDVHITLAGRNAVARARALGF